VKVTRHQIPSEFVISHQGVRLAAPAFVAAELAGTDGGSHFAEFLRTGLARQSEMNAALVNFTDCPGQLNRRRTFRNCEHGPWSFAEVRLHQILIDARITGWQANATIRVAGQTFHPDVLFDAERLVVEFDGQASHHARPQFIRDRERQNLLVLAGFRVLRFAWEHLDDPPYIAEAISRARNEMRSHTSLGA
jgi:very-short-patch-repair endonuclease